MPPFSDLESIVHDTIKDTFGEAVVYEPLSGGSYSLTGVFNDKHIAIDPNTEQTVSSNINSLGVKLADMQDPPKKGDFVTIRDVKYKVRDTQEDGEGWVNLFLYEV